MKKWVGFCSISLFAILFCLLALPSFALESDAGAGDSLREIVYGVSADSIVVPPIHSEFAVSATSPGFSATDSAYLKNIDTTLTAIRQGLGLPYKYLNLGQMLEQMLLEIRASNQGSSGDLSGLSTALDSIKTLLTPTGTYKWGFQSVSVPDTFAKLFTTFMGNWQDTVLLSKGAYFLDAAGNVGTLGAVVSQVNVIQNGFLGIGTVLRQIRGDLEAPANTAQLSPSTGNQTVSSNASSFFHVINSDLLGIGALLRTSNDWSNRILSSDQNMYAAIGLFEKSTSNFLTAIHNNTADMYEYLSVYQEAYLDSLSNNFDNYLMYFSQFRNSFGWKNSGSFESSFLSLYRDVQNMRQIVDGTAFNSPNPFWLGGTDKHLDADGNLVGDPKGISLIDVLNLALQSNHKDNSSIIHQLTPEGEYRWGLIDRYKAPDTFSSLFLEYMSRIFSLNGTTGIFLNEKGSLSANFSGYTGVAEIAGSGFVGLVKHLDGKNFERTVSWLDSDTLEATEEPIETDNMLDALLASQGVLQRDLAKLRHVLADDLDIEASDRTDPVKQEIVSNFTGDGNAAATPGQVVDMTAASTGISNALNTGASLGDALPVITRWEHVSFFSQSVASALDTTASATSEETDEDFIDFYDPSNAELLALIGGD